MFWRITQSSTYHQRYIYYHSYWVQSTGVISTSWLISSAHEYVLGWPCASGCLFYNGHMRLAYLMWCGGYNHHWLSGRLIAVLIDEQIELRIEMAKVIGCMCGFGNGCCHEIGDRRKEMNAETARLLR